MNDNHRPTARFTEDGTWEFGCDDCDLLRVLDNKGLRTIRKGEAGIFHALWTSPFPREIFDGSLSGNAT